jgi:hypothetical protein
MLKRVFFIVLAVFLCGLTVGCSNETQPTSPGTIDGGGAAKDGTETLGPPSIAIADGSGFVEGGVGMEGVTSGELTIDVPEGVQIQQTLLYWAGGASNGVGDDEISLEGTLIQGELIGGPIEFYRPYDFFAYRADITGLGLVNAGSNTLTVADFNFTGVTNDENNGAGILVIYDDGTAADLELRDGLDMAYFGFEPTLDATVPQDFAIIPADVDRTGDLFILAASVGENRPNTVKVSTAAGDQFFETPLGSLDGLTWDSLKLTVDIPAGIETLSVQLISEESQDPRGASLGWVAAGLAVEAVAVEQFTISGAVFQDADLDGFFDDIEWGIGAVVVELINANNEVVTTVTSPDDGFYSFLADAGDYTINISYDYPDDFNIHLGTSFAPTTLISIPVTIGPDSPGNNIGFDPLDEEIIADLEAGVLLSNNVPLEDWLKLLRRGLIEENSNRQAKGHGDDDPDHGPTPGWGHPSNYYDLDEILDFATFIESLYLFEPYQFTEGNEVQEIYDILKSNPRDDEGKLYVELLVTELNYAAGRGIIGQLDVVGVLISWGEALIVAGEDEALAGQKDRKSDLLRALSVFEALNTGGGGGVDE